MSSEPEHHHNWLTSIPDRLSYAWHAPEQRFEWLNLTRRRLFRNVANIPGELIGWSITTKERGQKPLLPDFSGNTEYKNPGQVIDSSLMTGILFKQVLDVGAKFGLSAFVKTTIAGYNRNEAYKGLLHTSSSLRHIVAHAVQSDPELYAWAQEMAGRDDGALLKLSRHSEQASQIMMDLAQGRLLPTEENLTGLQTQMQAMAELADRKAGVTGASDKASGAPKHPAYNVLAQHAPHVAAGMRYNHKASPSQHIRDVLKADRVNNRKQAVTYLATLSGLVADGALDISSELYTPKSESFFSAKDAQKVRRALQHFGTVQSTGLDVVAVANHIKSHIRDVEQKIEPLLAYADLHYADIDRDMASQTPERQPAATHVSRTPQAAGQHNAKPKQGYYKPNQVGLEYIVRDEAKHEMFKLYSRSLPSYLYQAPINLVERLILPNAKGKWEFNRNIIGSEIKAASWMALYNPAAESFGGVSTYEATRLDTHRSAKAGRRMDAFIAAAVRTSENIDPEFKDRMQSLSSNYGYRSLIDNHRDILNKPASERTQSDYMALSTMMRSLHDQAEKAQRQTRALLTGSSDESNLKKHVTDIFAHGAKTTGDALLIFTLTRFLEHAAEGDVLSYEYVDPEAMVMDRESLKRVSNTVLAVAEKRGFAIAGESIQENGRNLFIGEREGIAVGTLVRKAPDGGFVALTQPEFIGFANDVVQAIGQDQSALVQKFLTASHGRLSDTMVRDAERAMLEQFQPQSEETAPRQGETFAQKVILDATLKTHISKRPTLRERIDYITRPESVHEMTQLRDRYLAVSLFGFPVKLVTNVLRGDFNKVQTAFGKWSLASAGFAAVANTLAPSYGAVIMKEAVRTDNIQLKRDAEEADSRLQQTIQKLGESSPDMQKRLIASLGVNPLLSNTSTIQELALSDPDAALDATAKHFIDHTATALAGEPQSLFPQHIEKPAELLVHVMKLPDGNPAYAALKLAALSSVIGHEKQYIDALRFEGISARVLDNKKLKQVVDHIEDRFYTEGNMPENASPEYITAIADDLAHAALPVLESTLQEKHQEEKPDSDYFRRSIASSVSRGLNI